MRPKLPSLPAKAALLGALAAGGALGGGIALASASPGAPSGPSSPPPRGATSPAARRLALAARREAIDAAAQLARGADGKVVSNSSNGGAFGQGQLVIAEPDGTQLTFSLSNKTRAVRIEGVGKPPVAENPTAIPAGEIVLVRGVQVEQDVAWAPLVVDSGFAAG
jgi:hypothetical protein